MEVEDVGNAGAEHSEAKHGGHGGCGDVVVDVSGEYGEGEKLQGAAEHLAGGERDWAFGKVSQMVAGIGESDAVAGNGAQT